MIKRFVTYLAIPLALFGFASLAQADIEAPQTVIGTIKSGIEEARAVQEELNQIQADLRSAAEGVAGPIKDAAKTVNDAKKQVEDNVNAAKEKVEAAKNATSDPEGALSTMGSKMPGFVSSVDTNNQEEVQSAVKKNYFAQRPKKTGNVKEGETKPEAAAEAETDTVKISREHEEKMAAIQRENFANLYAQAFTIRTNLAKENAEKNDEKKKENSRDIIQATKDISLTMAKRLRKLMIMDAALFEFNMTQQARQFTFIPEEDEDE